MAEVKVSGRLEAKVDDVWALLRDFGGVGRYAPGIESCSVEGEGVGAVRRLTMAGGLRLQERLEALDDARHRLSYAIVGQNPLPLDGYLATIELREEGDACRIEWSGRFETRGISEEQGRAMVEGVYRGGIAGLTKALAR